MERMLEQTRITAGLQQKPGHPRAGGVRPEFLNYLYTNRFRIDDFARSADLYKRLQPDLMVSGRWAPRPVGATYLELSRNRVTGSPISTASCSCSISADFGAEGFGARLEPYRSAVRFGQHVALTATVLNPCARAADASVAAVVPVGWRVERHSTLISLPRHGEGEVEIFLVPPDGMQARRARVAIDMTVDLIRFGQQAEALVDVT